MKLNTMFILLGILISLSACKHETPSPQQSATPSELKQKLEKANTYLARRENEEIQGYIRRRKWPMEQTESGVYYWVYQEGKGLLVRSDEIVKLNYSLNLINGRKCYETANSGLLELKVGQYEVTGLSHALLKMKRGDKAKVIIPSHLGYGLMGDEQCVPSRATLIYDIEIL